MKNVEVIYKEYECADGCCYEEWYEINVDGKPISFIGEYGNEIVQRFQSISCDELEMILTAVTGEDYKVSYINNET